MIRFDSDGNVNLSDITMHELDRPDDPVVVELADAVRRMQRAREEAEVFDLNSAREVARGLVSTFSVLWRLVGDVPSIHYTLPLKGKSPARKDLAPALSDVRACVLKLETKLKEG